jgi:holo-[acyl-carrier protein] synthase
MTVRPGVDLVECERIARSIGQSGEAFLRRVFTESERSYCQSHARSAQSYAARWAAKEAVAKALGCGIGHGASLVEIEVTRDSAGQPGIQLHGTAAATAAAMGVQDIRLSLTHTAHYAAAFVIVTTA